MTDSKTPKNQAFKIVKKAMETPSPTKGDSSMDERSSSIESCTSSYTDDSIYLCAFCKRSRLRSETTLEDDEYDSDSTYNISEEDSFNTSDITYSSSGSGYMSMDDSSSTDNSRRSSDEGSDTSSYYCDRSASSSSNSFSDTDDFYSESAIGVDSYFTPLSAREFRRECRCEEATFIEIEE